MNTKCGTTRASQLPQSWSATSGPMPPWAKASPPQGEEPQGPSFGATGAHARVAGAWQAPGQFHSYKATAAVPCLGRALLGWWLADTAAVFSPQKPLVFIVFYLQSNIMLLVKKEVKKKEVKTSKA